MARRSAASARAGRAATSVRRTGRRSARIDFSDIPEASSAQLGVMRRVGRPPLGSAARRLIAIRIDPLVLTAVRREAKRRALGYQSLINQILAKHTSQPIDKIAKDTDRDYILEAEDAKKYGLVDTIYYRRDDVALKAAG